MAFADWFISSDEKERRETVARYHRLRAAFEASRLDRFDPDTVGTTMAEQIFVALGREKVPAVDGGLDPLLLTLRAVIKEFVKEERCFRFPALPKGGQLSVEDGFTLRASLRQWEAILANEATIVPLWLETLQLSLAEIVVSLPPPTTAKGLSLMVPVGDLLARPAASMGGVMGRVFLALKKLDEYDLFFLVAARLSANMERASGIHDPANKTRKPLLWPKDRDDLSPSELTEAYFDGTPFERLFALTLPFSIPFNARFEHTHVVAGSGHGKTQLLQHLILRDLDALEDGKGSIIVIDSQGDMLRTITHLAEFSPTAARSLSERLVLIDPNDVEHPPALNLFDFGLDRLNRYSPVEREKLVNGAIALYEYLFGALLGAELTQRQGVIFRYLARLMMAVPKATIHTLRAFMEAPDLVRAHLDQLDPLSRHFFESQFLTKTFDDTRQQILTRLWGVLSNSVLERMFANENNKLDLFEAMNRGSVILINTAKDLLKQEGCEILGRFFIALIGQAAQERAAIPDDRRRSTFVYIDEAQDYFDESIENLLNQARKYKVGLHGR